MKYRLRLAIVIAGLAGLSAQTVLAHDHDQGRDDDGGPVVTVAFGAGINTAQPGNSANHHVLPPVINVDAGDIVNFVVSGLHVIRVFDKGVTLKEVKAAIPVECLTNPPAGTPVPATCAPVLIAGLPVPVLAATAGPPATSLGLPLFYSGLNSLTPPAAPPFAPISVDQNRVEAVQFTTPGKYLVICGVLPHFNDGMTATIVVNRARGHDGH